MHHLGEQRELRVAELPQLLSRACDGHDNRRLYTKLLRGEGDTLCMITRRGGNHTAARSSPTAMPFCCKRHGT